jgi:hypothetical protein
VLNFLQDLSRLHQSDPKVRDHRHKRVNRRLRSGILGNPGFQFANALGKWVDVESGRKAPKAVLNVQEAMVQKVVVYIRNQDREGNPPPQFFDIGGRLGTMLAQRVDDFGIAAFSRIAGFHPQHRGG